MPLRPRKQPAGAPHLPRTRGQVQVPGWTCLICQQSNLGADPSCTTCAAPKGAPSRAMHDWSCSSCTLLNKSNRWVCRLCHNPRVLTDIAAEAPPIPSDTVPAKTKPPKAPSRDEPLLHPFWVLKQQTPWARYPGRLDPPCRDPASPSWSCLRCTTVHPGDSIKCTACSTSHPAIVIMNDIKSYGKKRAKTVSSRRWTPTSWWCYQCRVHNSTDLPLCFSCSAPREWASVYSACGGSASGCN